MSWKDVERLAQWAKANVQLLFCWWKPVVALRESAVKHGRITGAGKTEAHMWQRQVDSAPSWKGNTTPNWSKSISLLPSDVITECQRWQEGVALRINHVASASMTALVTVTFTKGLWWSNRSCDDFIQMSHTHTALQTPCVSLGKHYLILGDELMTGHNMTTGLISEGVNDKTVCYLCIMHRIVKQIQRTPLTCHTPQLYY